MKMIGWFSGLVDGGNKKLSLLLLLVVAAIAFVLFSGDWGSSNVLVQGDSVKQLEPQQRELDKIEGAMESKISAALQKMDGVGEVSVAITLLSGPKSEFGVNKTEAKTVQEEAPKEGGKRVSTQTNDNSQMVLAGVQSSGNQPVRITEYAPQISGVLIVAEGAKNPYVLERIHKSVQTLLGVTAARIRVEPMGKGGN